MFHIMKGTKTIESKIADHVSLKSIGVTSFNILNESTKFDAYHKEGLNLSKLMSAVICPITFNFQHRSHIV